MADLWDRLLARAAGVTSAVRPQRQVSDVLFFGTGTDHEDDVSPDAPHQDRAPSVRPTPRETGERPAQKPMTEPTRPPQSEPPRTIAPPREELASRPSAPAAVGEAPATERTVRPAHQAAVSSDHETAPSHGESSAPRPVPRPNVAAPAVDAHPWASVPPPAPVVAGAAPAPASVDPAPAPPRSEQDPGAAQHPPTRRQRTVSPRTAATPASPLSSRAVEDQAPVIRISIGRIDVRATTPRAPAAPASRTESAQPHLTLDAFLARSGNGGRR